MVLEEVNESNAVQWFEAQCLSELPRRPREATRRIEDFRESSLALRVALQLLQRVPLAAQAATPLAEDQLALQFHALSLAQYTLLARAESVAPAERAQWARFLREYLLALYALTSSGAAGFVTNKAAQVCVALAKQRWRPTNSSTSTSSTSNGDAERETERESESERAAFVHLLMHFLAPSAAAPHNALSQEETLARKLFGANLLLLALEDFPRKNAQDLGLSVNDVIQIKADFERNYLPQFFSIAVNELSQQLDALSQHTQAHTQAYTQRLSLVHRLLRCVCETVCWDYSEDSVRVSATRDRERDSQSLSLTQHATHRPPTALAAVLLDPAFVRALFSLYVSLGELSQHTQAQNELTQQCCVETQNLLFALSGLEGEIFSHAHAQCAYYTHFLSHTVALLDRYTVRSPHTSHPAHSPHNTQSPHSAHTHALLTLEASDFFSLSLRGQALSFAVRLCSNLFHHADLPKFLVWSTQISPDTQMAVCASLRALLAVTSEISGELCVVVTDMNVRLQRSHFRDVPAAVSLSHAHTAHAESESESCAVAQSWRVELLYALLELWQALCDARSLDVLSQYSLPPAQCLPPSTLSHTLAQTQSLPVSVILRESLGRSLSLSLADTLLSLFAHDALSETERESEDDDDSDAEGEGHEQEEAAAEQTLAALLASTGAAARTHAEAALGFLAEKLQSTCQDLVNMDNSLIAMSSSSSVTLTAREKRERERQRAVQETFCLERARLSVLLATHTLADDLVWTSDDEPKSLLHSVRSVSAYSSGETPTISLWLLRSLSHSTEGALPGLFEVVRQACALLSFQHNLLQRELARNQERASQRQTHTQAHTHAQTETGLSASPLLIQTLFRFLTATFNRYMDPNPEDYLAETVSQCAVLSSQSQALRGPEFNAAAEIALTTLTTLIRISPLETGAVRAACETLFTLSRRAAPPRLHLLCTASPALQHLLAGVYSSPIGAGLSVDGLACVTETLCAVLCKAKLFGVLQQICTSLSAEMQHVQQLGESSHSAARGLAVGVKRSILACLTGLARCPSTEDDGNNTIFSLFDSWWSFTQSHNALSQFIAQSDDLLFTYTFLVRDYSLHQLARLPDNSACLLYGACATLLSLFTQRLSQVQSALASDTQREEELVFHSEALLLLLDVLNHLSSKEFLFSDRDESDDKAAISDFSARNLSSIFTAHNAHAQQVSISLEQVPRLLIYGLQALLPFVSVDVLLCFPHTAERFFSYALFLCASHTDKVALWLRSTLEESKAEEQAIYNVFWEQIVVGMSLVDVVTARMAFQTLQLLATQELRALNAPTQQLPCLGLQLTESLLAHALPPLLRLAFSARFSQSSGTAHNAHAGGRVGVADRCDALAHTLRTLIPLHTDFFTHTATALLDSIPRASVRQLLSAQLQLLCTSRGVTVLSSRAVPDKNEKQRFALNFRDFVTAVQALPLD